MNTNQTHRTHDPALRALEHDLDALAATDINAATEGLADSIYANTRGSLPSTPNRARPLFAWLATAAGIAIAACIGMFAVQKNATTVQEQPVAHVVQEQQEMEQLDTFFDTLFASYEAPEDVLFDVVLDSPAPEDLHDIELELQALQQSLAAGNLFQMQHILPSDFQADGAL